MLLIRNIAFYLAFYLGSLVVTTGTLLALPFSHALFRKLVHAWSAWHRWCVVYPVSYTHLTLPTKA